MPVTATLSKKFYDKLGEEVTNELVNWLNAVYETSRADLREFNELNFARFDAKLEERLAEQDAKWERRLAEFDAKWGGRFADLEVRLAHQSDVFSDRIRSTEVRLATLTLAWVPIVLGIFEFVFRR